MKKLLLMIVCVCADAVPLWANSASLPGAQGTPQSRFPQLPPSPEPSESPETSPSLPPLGLSASTEESLQVFVPIDSVSPVRTVSPSASPKVITPDALSVVKRESDLPGNIRNDWLEGYDLIEDRETPTASPPASPKLIAPDALPVVSSESGEESEIREAANRIAREALAAVLEAQRQVVEKKPVTSFPQLSPSPDPLVSPDPLPVVPSELGEEHEVSEVLSPGDSISESRLPKRPEQKKPSRLVRNIGLTLLVSGISRFVYLAMHGRLGRNMQHMVCALQSAQRRNDLTLAERASARLTLAALAMTLTGGAATIASLC